MDLKKSLKLNEYQINVASVKIAFLVFISSIGTYLLNKIGVFILNSDDSKIVVLTIGAMTFFDFCLVYLLKIKEPWLKYVLMVNDCLITGVMYTFLSMHTVLMLAVPVVKACLYFNKRLSLTSGVVSAITMLVSHILSVYVSIVPDDPFTISQLSSLVYGFIPRYIQFALINSVVILVTRNTSKLFNEISAFEELKSAYGQLENAMHELNHSKGVAQALGDEFLTVFFVDVVEDCVRAEKIESSVHLKGTNIEINTEYSFSNLLKTISENNVVDDDLSFFLDLFSENSLDELISNDISKIQRINIKKDDGTSFCMEIHVVPAKIEGHPKGVVVGCRNIEELVQKEKAQMIAMKDAMLSAQKANSAKSGFLSRMSHDIRTPLNGIIGLFEIDNKHPDDIELWRENRKKAVIAANHLLSLINDVLDMSKLEDGSTVLANEPFDIFQITLETITIIKMRASDAGINMYYEGGSDISNYRFVYGSPLHIKQIFLNIYSNSIKYNKPNGSITTSLDVEKIDETHVMFIFKISDTGIGMSKEFLERLFEPFSQERVDARSVYQGTGLGMSIVKALIEKMNGTIEVLSEIDVGSTFIIKLPFEIAEKEVEVVNENVDCEADINGVKILLVEDNDLNMDIATSLLEDCGAIITPAENGRVAVDLFNSNPIGTFDVILMDVMMPVLDGLSATKEIRSIDREDAGTIPIIAMTANAFAEDIQNCKDAGMNEHLAKPLDIKKVTWAIHNNINN